jgi:aerobic carbon-monoxide dehydrogenase large subunit
MWPATSSSITCYEERVFAPYSVRSSGDNASPSGYSQCAKTLSPRSGVSRIAAMLEVSETDVEFRAPRFVVKGTDRSIGLFQTAAAALSDAVPPELRGTLAGIGDQVMSIPSYAYTCAVCEVEIEPETGLVEVVGYVSVDDCGRAVNPMLIHGQSHGGIAQGVGPALSEECVYDRDTAQLLSASLMDYAVPRADMLPLFRTEISEAIHDQPAWHAGR